MGLPCDSGREVGVCAPEDENTGGCMGKGLQFDNAMVNLSLLSFFVCLAPSAKYLLVLAVLLSVISGENMEVGVRLRCLGLRKAKSRERLRNMMQHEHVDAARCCSQLAACNEQQRDALLPRPQFQLLECCFLSLRSLCVYNADTCARTGIFTFCLNFALRYAKFLPCNRPHTTR